jgi:hypothetical protein
MQFIQYHQLRVVIEDPQHHSGAASRIANNEDKCIGIGQNPNFRQR